MTTRIHLLALVVLLAAGATPAETIHVDLPFLTGDYDSGLVPPDDAPRLRTGTFNLPAELATIADLSLVISGANLADGQMVCEVDIGGETHLDTLTVPTRMRLVLSAEPLGEGCFFGIVNLLEPEVVDAAGPVLDCDPGQPLDPDLLLGATIEASLECQFSPSCDPLVDARASLSEVRLEVEGELVAAGRRSWSGIKALYR
jgi:hypothetical protein